MPDPYRYIADPHGSPDPYRGEPTDAAIDEIIAYAVDWTEPAMLRDSDLLASLSEAIDRTATLLERNAQSRADDVNVDVGAIDFEPEARALLAKLLQTRSQAEIDKAFQAVRRAGR